MGALEPMLNGLLFDRPQLCIDRAVMYAFGVGAAINPRTLTICSFFLKIANLIGTRATAIFLQFSLQTRAAPSETAAALLAFYCERATALQ